MHDYFPSEFKEGWALLALLVLCLVGMGVLVGWWIASN